MIGGIDIDLPTYGNSLALEIGVRAIRQIWSTAVFEDAETGDRYNRFWQIPFGSIKELFVYPDKESADAWDNEGAIPSLSNKMIHLIADDEAITVVVDEKDAAMDEVVSSISSGLSDNIHFITAEAA